MDAKLTAIPQSQVALLPSPFQQRFEANRRYVMSLKPANLLQNHYLEAALWNPRHVPPIEGEGGVHSGWESPTCQVRGHFLGHWLSAMARLHASTGDAEVKARADKAVAELARCQERNGGGWCFSIPEKYLRWMPRGIRVWAPHYTIHKTLMGLCDMHAFAGSEQALDVLDGAAQWFHRWTGSFSREELDDIFDTETGGMLEAWADLYGFTGKPEHLDLVTRYDRPRLFEPLLAGDDTLTNLHANTTIPEAHGAARAYEVTGDERYRRIVEAYWQCAVTDRGSFATGGQTSGEIWTPPFELAARLGDKNQEHCTVYNMIRLADFLLRWTGEPAYADYIERNLYNGILAQQHPGTGMVAYFLPLQAGGRKHWGHPTHDFWCCHGTLVQAHTVHNTRIAYQDAEGLALCQYIPSQIRWEREGVPVTVRLTRDGESGRSFTKVGDAGAVHRPSRWVFDIKVTAERPVAFALKLRLPDWLAAGAAVLVNGETQAAAPGSFCTLRRTWADDTVRIELPTALAACPLPDEPATVAFLDGPVVLAGLCDAERALYGDPQDPCSILAPDNEREWSAWLQGYRAVGQPTGLRFKPLHQIVDEPYTVYFPIRPRA